MTRWMLYGAYGYTGKLLVEEAVRRGHRPLLAGRSAEKLAPLAEAYGLEMAAVSLDNLPDLLAALDGVDLVLHAAGPFIHTSGPMLKACLAAGCHYLDITGEIPVFQNTFANDAAARERGVALISGIGFDVVPTDCLSAYVAGQLAETASLELAIHTTGGASAGTLKSALELAPAGALVRRDGVLRPVPFGRGRRTVRFADGRRRTAVPIPWGDLVTAWHSTGAPNITTYLTMPGTAARALRPLTAVAQPLLRLKPVRRMAAALIGRWVDGPDAMTRQTGRSFIWARARDRSGKEAEAWLETLEAYRFTAVAGVHSVEETLDRRPAGALTPSMAFGADFVCRIEGTRRLDWLDGEDKHE